MCCADGILCYYKSQADYIASQQPANKIDDDEASSKKSKRSTKASKPCKNIRINLRNYGVDSMRDDATRFTLVPTPDAFRAFQNAGGEGAWRRC